MKNFFSKNKGNISASFPKESAGKFKATDFTRQAENSEKKQAQKNYQFHYKPSDRYSYGFRRKKPVLESPSKKIFAICMLTAILYIFLFFLRSLSS